MEKPYERINSIHRLLGSRVSNFKFLDNAITLNIHGSVIFTAANSERLKYIKKNEKGELVGVNI